MDTDGTPGPAGRAGRVGRADRDTDTWMSPPHECNPRDRVYSDILIAHATVPGTDVYTLSELKPRRGFMSLLNLYLY